MPLEIRELIIKASIGDEQQAQTGAASTDNDQEKEKVMIQSCVEAVLDILKQRSER